MAVPGVKPLLMVSVTWCARFANFCEPHSDRNHHEFQSIQPLITTVSERTTRFISRLHSILTTNPPSDSKPANILVFAHSHLLRVLAATFLRLPPKHGHIFTLSTASISELGFEHGRIEEPCIKVNGFIMRTGYYTMLQIH